MFANDDEPDGDEIRWFDLGVDDRRTLEEAADQEVCDHDDYKQVVPLNRSMGGNVLGVGLNGGTTVSKIVCTKCHTEYDVSKNDSSGSSGGLLG